MLRVLVCVSGGGTNLQALIDGVENGRIRNAEIVRVISNNRNAYALTVRMRMALRASAYLPAIFGIGRLFMMPFCRQWMRLCRI